MYKEQLQKTSELLLTAGVLLTMVLTPIVISLNVQNISGLDSKYTGAWAHHYDLYHFAKAKILWGLSIFCLPFVLIRLTNEYVSRKLRAFSLLLFCLFTTAALSAMFAENNEISFSGFPGIYFGFFSFVAVLLIFISATLIVREKNRTLLFTTFLVTATLVSGLTFGGESLDNKSLLELLLDLILPLGTRIFSQSSLPASTLYNANYLAVYASIGFLFSTVLFVWGRRQLLWVLAAHFVCLLVVLDSKSKAALLTCSFMISCLLIFLLARREKYKVFRLLPAVAILLTPYSIPSVGTHDQVRELSSEVKKVSKGSAAPLSNRLGEIKLSSTAKLSYSNSTLEIQYKDLTWKVLIDGVTHLEKNILEETIIGERIFHNISMSTWRFRNMPAFTLQFNRLAKLDFVKTLRGFRVLLQNNIFNLEPVTPHILPIRPSFLTNRGFIWNAAIYTLRDNFIFGHGLDSFPLVFPQHDLVSKLKVYGNAEILIDKTHSFYIQLLHGNGVLGLTLYFVFFAFVLVTYLRNWRKVGIFEHASMFAVLGWHILGISNDATVGTAPTAFALMGLTRNAAKRQDS